MSLFTITLLTSCESNDNWTEINKKDYSVSYPKSWNIDTSGYGGAEFSFLTVDTTSEDLFTDNVTLGIQDLTGKEIDLNKFVELSEEQVKTLVNDGELLESKTMNDKKHPYQKFVYTLSQSGIHLKVAQYYWVVNEKAYILTFTAETSKYDTYKADGEAIMNSFELKL